MSERHLISFIRWLFFEMSFVILLTKGMSSISWIHHDRPVVKCSPKDIEKSVQNTHRTYTALAENPLRSINTFHHKESQYDYHHSPS